MRQRLLAFFFFLCHTAVMLAQDVRIEFDNASLPLNNVISQLESKFSVRFSYNSDRLQEKALQLDGTYSLTKVLNEISRQHALEVRKIDASNYVIVLRDTNDALKSICGQVIDQATGEPLEGVTLVIEGAYRGTITNEEGRFTLDGLTAKDQLSFQYLGYQTVLSGVDRFEDPICPTLEMTYDTNQLHPVLITEYVTTGFDRNNSDGSIEITPKKLGILPGLIEPDVLQSLQLLPGITSPSESAANLHIRGGTPDQNLVLWDGIKMYHQGHFFGQISAFNPYITEEIKLYQSGTSPAYGDRISGVIDIRSTREVPDEISAGGGFNFTQADAYVKIPIDSTFGLIASARRSFSDIVETITFNNLSDKVFQNTKIGDTSADEDESIELLRNEFRFTDFNVKAIWQPDARNYVSLSSLFVTNRLDYASTVDMISTSDQLNLTNNGYSFLWDHSLSNDWQLSLKSYLSEYDSNFMFAENNVPDNDQFEQIKNNTVNDFGATLQSQYRWKEKHRLLGGYDFSRARVTYLINGVDNGVVETNENEDDLLNTHAGYLEYRFLSSSWLVRAGVRANYLSSNSQWYAEPRLYLETTLSQNFRVKTSGEIKNQSISQLIQFEFNEIGVGNNIWVLADAADIPVLNIRQTTLGVLFQKDGWNIDIDGYLKKTRGITSFSRGFDQSNTEGDDYSEGTSESIGLDILIKKKTGPVRSWLSYSLSQTNFLFPELQASSFAGNFDQRHVLNFANTLTIDQLQISLGWYFATGVPYTIPSGIGETEENDFFLIFDQQNTARLESFHRLDASVMYDIFFGKQHPCRLRLGLSALNLYDRQNEIEKDFRIEFDADENQAPQVEERTKFGLGLTPNVLVRLDF